MLFCPQPSFIDINWWYLFTQVDEEKGNWKLKLPPINHSSLNSVWMFFIYNWNSHNKNVIRQRFLDIFVYHDTLQKCYKRSLIVIRYIPWNILTLQKEPMPLNLLSNPSLQYFIQKTVLLIYQHSFPQWDKQNSLEDILPDFTVEFICWSDKSRAKPEYSLI